MPKSELAKTVACYKEVFGSGAGKVVFDDLQKSFHNRISHVRGDSHETAFKEGQRSAFLRIKYMVETKLEDIEENTNG